MHVVHDEPIIVQSFEITFDWLDASWPINGLNVVMGSIYYTVDRLDDNTVLCSLDFLYTLLLHHWLAVNVVTDVHTFFTGRRLFFNVFVDLHSFVLIVTATIWVDVWSQYR